jgi:hypothetical protein
MSLRAHCIHRPLTAIGQAHILTAIWQFGGQELKAKRRDVAKASLESIKKGSYDGTQL